MNRKTIGIGLAVLLLLCCMLSFAAAMPGSADSLGGVLFVLLLCGLPVAVIAISLAWIIRHNRRSRRAGQTVAEQFDLAPLNESSDPLARWYGGDHDGRALAVKPLGTRERTYSEGGYTISASFWLRFVIEVRLAVPLGFAVEPGSADLDALDPAAQAALRDFIEKGYPTGISGTTLRTSKGTRSLALYDRTAVPANLGLPDFVLPEAKAVLLHDHRDTDLSRAAAAALLDDLAAVATALETASGADATPPTNQKE